MQRRDVAITWFVIVWLSIFTYETFRASYLSPLFKRELPKLPLLFPPAGWIMFYRVDPSYGFAEVRGIRAGQPITLDPHEIFSTKGVGYDNIHRNMLVGVLNSSAAPSFCRYLHRKFPQYEAFAIFYGQYPDVTQDATHPIYQLAYRCLKE